MSWHYINTKFDDTGKNIWRGIMMHQVKKARDDDVYQLSISNCNLGACTLYSVQFFSHKKLSDYLKKDLNFNQDEVDFIIGQ